MEDWVKKMRRARVIRLLQTVTNPRLLVAKDPIYSGLAPPIHQERNRENLKIHALFIGNRALPGGQIGPLTPIAARREIGIVPHPSEWGC